MPNYVTNTITLTGKQSDIDSIFELLKNKNTDRDEEIDFNNVVPMPSSMNIAASSIATWYIASYVKTLPDEEKFNLIQKLLKHSDGFYKSYFHKYKDAFTKDIPVDILNRMQKTFQEEYSAINPSSIEKVGKTYIDNILNYGADTWYDWACTNWGTKWGAMDSYISENNIEFQTAWSAALPITEKLSELYPDVRFSHEWADEDIGRNCGRYVYKGGQTISEYLPEGEEALAFACYKWGYDEEEYGINMDDYDFQDIDPDTVDIVDTSENLPLESRINSVKVVVSKELGEGVKTKNIAHEHTK